MAKLFVHLSESKRIAEREVRKHLFTQYSETFLDFALEDAYILVEKGKPGKPVYLQMEWVYNNTDGAKASVVVTVEKIDGKWKQTKIFSKETETMNANETKSPVATLFFTEGKWWLVRTNITARAEALFVPAAITEAAKVLPKVGWGWVKLAKVHEDGSVFLATFPWGDTPGERSYGDTEFVAGTFDLSTFRQWECDEVEGAYLAQTAEQAAQQFCGSRKVSLADGQKIDPRVLAAMPNAGILRPLGPVGYIVKV